MHFIPVSDRLAGQVMRAGHGERSAYRPIGSPLCGSSDPRTAAATLVAHCAAGGAGGIRDAADLRLPRGA